MKAPISRYEAIGIFGSVAIMAIALVLISVKTDLELTDDSFSGDTQQGSIVVADTAGDENEERALANALGDASDGSNTLKRLVIDDVRIGTGAAVKTGDTVSVHYIGSTRDGVQFDSSYDRGAPFTFTLGEGKVIEGWEKGVLGMKVGGQRILVIPPEMAYGNRQVGPIEPGSVLVFAVELLDIK